MLLLYSEKTFNTYAKKIYYRRDTIGYTEENGWPIEQLVEYGTGDINGDGKVNVNDLNYGLRGLTGNTLSENEKEMGDVNGDNLFNVNDLNKLLRYLVGKIRNLA